MHPAEKICTTVRHAGFLAQADWLWDRARPLYDQVLSLAGRSGLERVINGTDSILVAPKFRSVPERYEPDVWKSLMNDVRVGDSFADIGVYIGLYTIAVAKRIGAAGSVYAFEPDPANLVAAREHIRLNGLDDRVELVPAAAGDRDDSVPFKFMAESGHVTSGTDLGTSMVKCITLDRFFSDKKLDLLKIDVEGYEEKVLKGAAGLLSDLARCPRAIYLEVHPYAWPAVGTTSESLLSFLSACGYQVRHLNGEPANSVERYGEIIARKD